LRGGSTLRFYPINLNLKEKKVLIVGAGKVAFRKFKRLLQAKAQIKVVSPEFSPKFTPYFEQKSDQYIFIERKFREDDLGGIFLVFAATNDSQLNERIAFLSRNKNILANISDAVDISDFTVPAAVNRGELLLTVSSGSNLPALSQNIRKKIEQEFGVEYQILLEIMQKKRSLIIAEIDEISVRKKIFKELASDQFLNKIRMIIDQFDLNLLNIEETDKFINNKNNLSENKFKLLSDSIETEINKIIAKLKDD
jgi:precorrin-2 dehydrogenase/sirohydrochlorin ferrochelatase